MHSREVGIYANRLSRFRKKKLALLNFYLFFSVSRYTLNFLILLHFHGKVIGVKKDAL